MLFPAALRWLPLLGSAAAALRISEFDWTAVEPSTSLVYTPCYDGHKCARLSLPLDWLSPDRADTRVTVAIIARPAVVNETDPSFGGTIIVNPGGPGSAGIDYVLTAGKLLQKTADGRKKYEILSFDPRGVGMTTPNADCFQNQLSRGQDSIIQQTIGTLGLLAAGKDDLQRLISRAQAFGSLCQSKSTGPDDIRYFMSTSSVARDMLEMVDKISEARRGTKEPEVRLELRSDPATMPQIQYWGMSYGTTLGTYFASMFPGRVGRMILEGMVDVQDYVDGEWAMKVNDIQKVYDYFWSACYDAGVRCALYQETDTNPNDARSRFDSFLDELDQFPSSHLVNSNIVTITRYNVMLAVYQGLIQPQLLFNDTATSIAAAMVGDFAPLMLQLGLPDTESCSEPLSGSFTWRSDASIAIRCGDSEPQTNMTVSDYRRYMEDLQANAPDFWPFFADLRLPCVGWPLRPKFRSSGPWAAFSPDSVTAQDAPAAPILYISSRLDPLTPAANAIAAAKNRPGSSVLLQDMVGHGAILSPSKCRENYIKEYFEAGKMVPDGTICAAECVPFQDCEVGL